MAAVDTRHQGSNSIAEIFGGVAESCTLIDEDGACLTWSARVTQEPAHEHKLGNETRSSHIAMDLLTDDMLLQV